MNSNPSNPRNNPVIIVPYDPTWVHAFENEAALIHQAIGIHIENLEHIGSTSVPGLAAKPIIDILIGLKSLSDSFACIPLLEELGYSYVPEFEDNLPERRYFERMNSSQLGYHVHMVETSSEFFLRHIAFRDYLRSHPSAAQEYASLKIGLAKQYGSDREGYTDAKTEFIKGIEQLAMK